MKAQVFQSFGQFVLTVVTGLLVYKGWSDVVAVGVANALWLPVLQGIIVAGGVLGLSKIGPKS